MTPEEEEIMRIYEDRVYQPPDLIKRPEGFQIRIICVRPGSPVVSSAEDEPDARDTALGRAALPRSNIEAAEDEPKAGGAALG